MSASNEASSADCLPNFRAVAQNSAAFSITDVVIGAYPSRLFNASRRPSPLSLPARSNSRRTSVIRDLRNHHLDSVVGKTRQPVLARLIFWGAFRIRDHSERTGVQQNDQA